MIPKRPVIEKALLALLGDRGAMRPADVYTELASRLALTNEDLQRKTPKGDDVHFNKEIRWAKKSLQDRGLILRANQVGRGYWNLSDAGASEWSTDARRGAGEGDRDKKNASTPQPALAADGRLCPDGGSDEVAIDATERLDADDDAEVLPGSHDSDERDFLGTIEQLQLSESDRDALVKVRVGQSRYRDGLLAYWKACAVTGCPTQTLLRASHIVPWRHADNAQKVDPYNGLLLTPNLDLAFDLGYISFDDSGRIIFSSALDEHTAAALHLRDDMRLSRIDPLHQPYLAWHREHILQRAKSEEGNAP